MALRATSGAEQAQQDLVFDHPIGADERVGRDGDT
jgi:hypothetical protein